MNPDQLHALAIRRFILVSLVLPVVIVAIGVVVQLIALPQMPATIAVHWNAAGEPNRYAPAWTQPLLTIAFGAGIPLLIGLASLPGLKRGDRGSTYRLMGALSPAVATLITVAFTWTFAMQAGGSPQSTQSVWPALIASLALAAVVAVLAWFVQPREDRVALTVAQPRPIPIAPGERVVWLRTTTMAPAAVIAIALGVVALGVGAYVTWLAGGSEGIAWLLLGIAVVLAILAATMVSFHVRVDDDGLTVRSVLGIPRFRVPVAEIATVSTVEVNPMGEFGGWGIRPGADRRLGVILRAGDAIEVARTNGKRLVITVDDAATGAALLEALIQRDAAPRP